MKPTFYLIEDKGYEHLYPLTYARPVFELRAGMRSLREHFLARSGLVDVACLMRKEVLASFSQAYPQITTTVTPGDSIVINGRLIADDQIIAAINELSINEYLITKDREIIAARVEFVESTDPFLVFAVESLSTGKAKTVEANLIHYPWDLVFSTPQLISEAAKESNKLGKIDGAVSESARLSANDHIYIAVGAKVAAGVVLAADDGPIYIDEGAEIMPNATIIGPAYIGKNSLVKVGAKIYGGTSIGNVCKVGGEIEGSIIHGYSNKQHEGFLGHSYIGTWCNLGADTNNSDLKNNYGNVDVIINGDKIDTGHMFVGLIMGDHSKSGINTMFNTGTVVGFSCNVFGADYLPKSIPSFTWLNNSVGPVEYKLEKALEVAERVTARRHVMFSKIDRELFTHVFSLTKHERSFSNLVP